MLDNPNVEWLRYSRLSNQGSLYSLGHVFVCKKSKCLIKYSCLHIGQSLFFLFHLVMQYLQNVCEHPSVVAVINSSAHMTHCSSLSIRSPTCVITISFEDPSPACSGAHRFSKIVFFSDSTLCSRFWTCNFFLTIILLNNSFKRCVKRLCEFLDKDHWYLIWEHELVLDYLKL